MQTEQKLRKMTSSKLFEMINQEFKVQGTIYQVLQHLESCCREQGGTKVTSARAYVRSFCSGDMHEFYHKETAYKKLNSQIAKQLRNSSTGKI